MARRGETMEYPRDIDERLPDAARRSAGTSDIRQLVATGLRELVRQEQLKELVESFGTFNLDITDEPLLPLRRSEPHRLGLDER
jgi:hypothetical protein